MNLAGESRRLGSGAWAKDFRGGRESLASYPARFDPTQFFDTLAVLAKLSANALGPVNEIQTVVVDATGGTFTLTYAGQTTAAIAWNAAPNAVEAALELLSNIGENDVQVTGTASNYTIQFRLALAGTNVAQLTSNPASLTGGAGTVTHATTTQGAGGATSLAVDALDGPIPAGTVLDFGGNKFARTTADVAAGAVAIPVSAIQFAINDNDEARYQAVGGSKLVPSGSLLGRTFTEAAANTPYGKATDTDDEIYFMAFDCPDANVRPDAELYLHGRTVATNFLPRETQDLLTANAALLAKVRVLYVCIIAED